ncbi:MAG: DNA polymerase Y family protein [Candidatus Microsaccharimonas sp.]
MNNTFNTERPLIMHIDLNSCFATVEQQARPMLRGKPVAIVNRRTDKTAIVTASYEAKAKGVKVGMKLKEAMQLCPGLIPLESDPSKYRYVYHKLLAIMNDYSAHVTMKSIDEGVIDFHQTSYDIAGRDLVEIGYEIKQRLKDEIGVWMRCNIGIATNRFLAKTAAGLHKPDGLDVITSHNIVDVLSSLKLTDLTGIASRNEHRLNSVGIYTPLQFLEAEKVTLQKIVFKSIVGEWWYKRLRGFEVDDVETQIGRVGRQYVLERFDLSHTEITQRLHHLCESVGGRMRRQGLAARGVYVYAKTLDRGYWHSSTLSPLPFFSDRSIYTQALQLFAKAPDGIREIGIHCYELTELEESQMSIFADEITRERQIVGAVDNLNHRFGERTVHSANTLATGIYVNTKIPFGSTRYL